MQPSATPDAAAEKMTGLARAHLARKLGISVDAIFAAEVSAVLWPDAGLGCPLPGVSYAAVVTPGFSILLESQGRVFVYHTDMDSRVVLCSTSAPTEIYLPP